MGFAVLRALRNSGKKKFFFLPYLFTFANALCGFLSILKTLEGAWVAAAYCIMLAAIMDMLDGRIARMLGSTSYLGMELDSLCDAISFCLAPAVLLYSWRLWQGGTWVLLVLILYLCAGLFRLARFNALGQMKQPYFLGLPTTIVAFFFANLIVYEGWLAQRSFFSFFIQGEVVTVLVGTLALLMISPVPFPSFKYYYPSKIVRLLLLTALLLAIFMGVRYHMPLVLFGIAVYISAGILYGWRTMMSDKATK